MGACKLAARFIVTSKRMPIKTVKGYSECAATRARRRRRPAEDFITCWLVWLALNSVVRKNTLTFTQNNHGRRTLHHNKPVRAPGVAWPITKNVRTSSIRRYPDINQNDFNCRWTPFRWFTCPCAATSLQIDWFHFAFRSMVRYMQYAKAPNINRMSRSIFWRINSFLSDISSVLSVSHEIKSLGLAF